MVEKPSIVFALIYILLLHNLHRSNAWFLDQETTTTANEYYGGIPPYMENENPRPVNSWQPSEPASSFDSLPVNRPSTDWNHSPSHHSDPVMDSTQNFNNNPGHPTYVFNRHSDNSPPHVPSYGHDRPSLPVQDNYGNSRGFFDHRQPQAPVAPPPPPGYNPYDPDSMPRPESSPVSNRGGYPFDNSRIEDHKYSGPVSTPPELAGQLQNCKCVCNNEAMNAEHYTNMVNWIKGAQMTPQDVVCHSTSIPSEGSAAFHGAQGPKSLPHGQKGVHWILDRVPAVSRGVLMPSESAVEELEGRREVVTAAPPPCPNEEPGPVVPVVDPSTSVEETIEYSAVVDEIPPSEPEEASVNTGETDTQQEKQIAEFKSGSEMSESAVAGLVCGIFAVVVLIVVVVVSRKVIVASAEKAKRKTEQEEQVDAYDDLNCYSKSSSSSAGYPPRYL